MNYVKYFYRIDSSNIIIDTSNIKIDINDKKFKD